MALVVLLDQRKSKDRPDLVGEWSTWLNETLHNELELPFTRTAGDEMQAVLRKPAALGKIAQAVFVSESWWLGVGIGEVESPRPGDPREGRGPAFWAAREAIGKAASQRGSRPVAVSGSTTSDNPSPALNECLGALAYIISRRTPQQRRVAEAYHENDRSVKKVAGKLGTSVQGARQRVTAAGCEEELDLIRLSERLVGKAVRSWD